MITAETIIAHNEASGFARRHREAATADYMRGDGPMIAAFIAGAAWAEKRVEVAPRQFEVHALDTIMKTLVDIGQKVEAVLDQVTAVETVAVAEEESGYANEAGVQLECKATVIIR